MKILLTISAVMAALAAAPVAAATVTYGFVGGSQTFGSAPDTATATGSFVFDTVVNNIVSGDFDISGTSSSFDTTYDVSLLTLGSAGGIFLTTGTDLSGNLTGELGFSISVASALGGPGPYELFFVSLGTCGDSTCSSFSSSNYQSSLFNGPFGQVEEIAPVPLPATLPLLLAGVAAIGAIARRRHRFLPLRLG